MFHGYTYSGIPVAVAAALAVQDIFEKEDILKESKIYLLLRRFVFIKRYRLC